MSDLDILTSVETIVAKKKSAGEMFTAFDITREVRDKLGKSVNVPHSDVKQEVHSLFAIGRMGPEYVRTQASIAGVSPQPWIYHRSTDDPHGYTGAGLQITLISVSSSDSQSDDAVNHRDGDYLVDARGTLCLPVKLLRDCGIHAGEEAYAAYDLANNCLVVSKDEQPSLVQLAKYTADGYGNVRVTRSSLQLAAMDGNAYSIESIGSQYVRIRSS